MKAIGYVRVSTEQQADWGVSLEAQTEKVHAMAVVQGAQSLEMIVDAESAKSLNRSGMTRLLSLVDAGEADVVIIAKLDRLTRSVANSDPVPVNVRVVQVSARPLVGVAL